MVPLRNMISRARRILARDTGNASVEFVIIFPVFMILFVSCFESGLLMTRHVMLDRAVDLSVRGLRLGTWTPPTHEALKKNICNIAGIIPDCMNNIMVELRPVSTTTWAPLAPGARCRDRSQPINPVADSEADKEFIKGGTENEMMLVRVCAIMNPIFPATGLGLQLPRDAKGGYALVSTSAFVNEPS